MGAFVPVAAVTTAFGDPIVVMLPQGAGDISTTGVWIPADSTVPDQSPIETDYTRWDARRLMTIPLTATLPTVPKGTLIRAISEDGSGPFTWRVDEVSGPREADAVTVVLARTAD